MDLSESQAEANRILRDAGWTPIPNPVWKGGYAVETFVGGLAPDGLTQYVKNWAQIKAGDPLYSADTPDEPHEAAQWLVDRYAPVAAKESSPEEPITYVLAPVSEEGESLGDERETENGDYPEGVSGEIRDTVFREESGPRSDAPDDGRNVAVGNGSELPEAAFDADFTIEDLGAEDELAEVEGADTFAELPAPDPEDFAPEELADEQAPQDRFIGLDDLDRRRSLRIGDTIRHANTLMPAWSDVDQARLGTLRNFAMGVSEGRWNDDPAQKVELDALETTLRRINEIKEARDQKVVFLERADRAGVEGFVVEEGWP
jgi:hypothetical protein